ncbi:MAG: ribonuclease P protein component [Pseudomonadota bacterium]
MTAPAHGLPGDRSPLPGSQPGRLTQRSEFLRAARAHNVALPGFVLQGHERGDGTHSIRAGFTCSKKVGNAVARNRAKRRLREVVRLDLSRLGKPGWDYVLIGRKDTTSHLPFDVLRRDLGRALAKLHRA